VAVAAVNYGESATDLPQMAGAEAWVMTAQPLDSDVVSVNGSTPAMGDDGTVSGLDSVTATETHTVPAQSVVFYSLENAANPACS
jgi:hypothetical protein